MSGMTSELDQYVVNAFANHAFTGNPAAVVPLNQWLPDAVMQSIAEQNNLAETAFYIDQGEHDYRIRWFTPSAEVDLCGHATLAAAFVLNHRDGLSNISFDSRSGPLHVSLQDAWWLMDFPSQAAVQAEAPLQLLTAMRLDQAECYFNEDYLLVLENEQLVLDLDVHFESLLALQGRGVIVTSASKQYDFVHRFFAPKVGVNEDPVTGSAMTKLIPYWAKRLNKTSLSAKQLSNRGGEIKCHYNGERVGIAGQANLFAQAKIFI